MNWPPVSSAPTNSAPPGHRRGPPLSPLDGCETTSNHRVTEDTEKTKDRGIRDFLRGGDDVGTGADTLQGKLGPVTQRQHLAPQRLPLRDPPRADWPNCPRLCAPVEKIPRNTAKRNSLLLSSSLFFCLLSSLC